MTTAATPDVTVTVIVYNDAGRLPRAVESVRRQAHRNLEIVISDDHSTDDTPRVARELAARDPRIRYLRLPENSGGCSAPRNRALEIARAPYLMFLDSDDELPADAVELLLAAHREREIDFAMGAVRRIRVDTGRRSTWMPHLVRERRTLDGIEDDPRLFFEHLSTGKMYARAFLDRHDLRFPEGIHYEDQLFSAQAYCLAKRFTVVPEPVYLWYVAPYASSGAASISNQRHLLTNVRDRIHVQRLIDAFLVESGHAALREDKDHKFLKHDFRMYAGDLPYRDDEWLDTFADLVNPYLATLSPGAYARLPRTERVVLQLVRDRRPAEARLAARGLGHAVAPRQVATDADGRVYWGGCVPGSADARRELDLSELDLDTVPFFAARFRHEITTIGRGPRCLPRPDRAHLRPGPAPPGRPAAREPGRLARPAPAHRPLPALPRLPGRLRRHGPPRRGGGPAAAARLRGSAPSGGPPHLRGPGQPGGPAGAARLPAADRPHPLPLGDLSAPAHRRAGGPHPGPAPAALGTGGRHRRRGAPGGAPAGPAAGAQGGPPGGERAAVTAGAAHGTR
ncbi:glycosyltransferase involved in cell wall biosynthesis [Streptomyces calvus]